MLTIACRDARESGKNLASRTTCYDGHVVYLEKEAKSQMNPGYECFIRRLGWAKITQLLDILMITYIDL